MSTFLVTGGVGFIGSHLTDLLLSKGHRVIAFDDLSTGRRENVAHLAGRAEFELVEGDVRDRSRLAALMPRVDGVFHLAAAVGVRLVVESPVRTVESNVVGTAIVLDLANELGKPVLVTSSSEVYGKSTKVPFSEDDDILFGPTRVGRWSYGCSKAIDEYLALAYARERALPVVVVRLFNTTGPRQTGRYGMVVPRFVRQALAGEPLSVYGDGTQRRCFCYVGDVVGALVRLIDCAAANGRVVNIGSDEEVTIFELAERVCRITGSASPIERIPYDQAWDDQFEDMPRRVPDLTRIRALIGFRAGTPLDEMIRRVAAHERAA